MYRGDEMSVTLKDFLKNEVKPALGCTEPGAVALAVAQACDGLPDRDKIVSIHVVVSTNIYKNGMAVGIPGTRGARGNLIAAALGAICGDASLGLECLSKTAKSDVEKAARWVEGGQVTIYCDPDKSGVYVSVVVSTPEHKAVCCIEKSHANITQIMLDEKALFKVENVEKESTKPAISLPDTFEETISMADEMDDADVDFLMEGVLMNFAVAERGFSSDEDCHTCGECVIGSRFGRSIHRFVKNGTLANDLANEIRSTCAAASDARMSGVLMPVMSSAGSGNHGITAILPVAILARAQEADQWQTAKALAISHLATSYVKRSLGRLSPVCGCALAAGAGAAAGMAYLLGGTIKDMGEAMNLVLGNLAGMLCDGAKESCALKVSVAAAEAHMAAHWAVSGEHLKMAQGVVGASVDETVANLGMIERNGLEKVDRLIIDILNVR